MERGDSALRSLRTGVLYGGLVYRHKGMWVGVSGITARSSSARVSPSAFVC
jgi:hypothetical protein